MSRWTEGRDSYPGARLGRATTEPVLEVVEHAALARLEATVAGQVSAADLAGFAAVVEALAAAASHQAD